MTLLSCYSFDKLTFQPTVQLLKYLQKKFKVLNYSVMLTNNPCNKFALPSAICQISAFLKKISSRTSYPSLICLSLLINNHPSLLQQTLVRPSGQGLIDSPPVIDQITLASCVKKTTNNFFNTLFCLLFQLTRQLIMQKARF